MNICNNYIEKIECYIKMQSVSKKKFLHRLLFFIVLYLIFVSIYRLYRETTMVVDDFAKSLGAISLHSVNDLVRSLTGFYYEALAC